MSEHPPDADLRQFVSHTLPAHRVVAVADHLAGCAACRDRAARLGDASRQLVELHVDALAGDLHLTEEQVTRYVAGEIGEQERGAIARHLEACDVCAADVEDLRALDGRRVSSSRWYLAAAAIVALVLVPLVLSRWTPRADPSGETVLAGLALLSDTHAANVRRALDAGFAEPPDWITAIGSEALMGAPAAGNTFELSAPVHTATLSDRPQFRWTALSGADAYTVAVFDTALNPVVGAEKVSSTDWIPPEPLTRDRTYVWQVTAHRGAESLTVPAPPAPMATFRVLDRQTVDAIDTVMRAEPESHVLLGILFAQAGVVDEARAHLERVPAEDPHAGVASNTLARLPRVRQ